MYQDSHLSWLQWFFPIWQGPDSIGLSLACSRIGTLLTCVEHLGNALLSQASDLPSRLCIHTYQAARQSWRGVPGFRRVLLKAQHDPLPLWMCNSTWHKPSFSYKTIFQLFPALVRKYSQFFLPCMASNLNRELQRVATLSTPFT